MSNALTETSLFNVLHYVNQCSLSEPRQNALFILKEQASAFQPIYSCYTTAKRLLNSDSFVKMNVVSHFSLFAHNKRKTKPNKTKGLDPNPKVLN